MKYKFTLFIVCFTSVVLAQDWANYKPLQATGEIPSDFTDAYINKYEFRVEEDQTDDGNQKQKNDFLKQNEFFIDELLISGDVIFGDPISEYCEKILDLLLKNEPELRAKLRVYLLKSPVVNASATANGIIFVNTGLMAQLENEAQLAFVLAHEVVHYKKEHVFNRYVEVEKVNSGKDLYKKASRAEKLRALSTYSKDHELEADKMGVNRFYQRSGYSAHEPIFAMDILQYSYLPFDEIAFDTTFFNTENFIIPTEYILKELAPITADEDYDDSESSHPNIKRRKMALRGELKLDEPGKRYIVSEEKFKDCQRMARYENSRLFLNIRNYPEAIYNTYLLGVKYGVDKYQELTIAKALTAAAAYRNNSYLDNVTTSYKKIEGASQQVYFLFHEFSKDEMAVLAVDYTYRLLKKYPEDKDIRFLFDRALEQLTFENELRPGDFAKQAFGAKNAAELYEEQDSVLANRSSKIRNIKRKKLEDEVEQRLDFHLYAFVGYWDDPVFSDAFEDMAEKSTDEDNKDAYYEYANYKERNKYDKNLSLGIDKVIYLTPKYLKLDEREKDGIGYITTDESLENYRGQIVEMSQKAGLNYELLDYKNINSTDIELFNDITILKNWMEERLNHDEINAVVSDFDVIRDIRAKYQSDYLVFTGNLTMRTKEKMVAGRLIYSTMLVFPLPFTIAQILIPDYESFNFMYVMNLKTGKFEMVENNYYETSDGDDYLRSVLYNYIIQIKK